MTPLVVAPKSTVAEWKKVARLFGIEAEVMGYEKARGSSRNRAVSTSAWGKEVLCGKGSRWEWNQSYALVIFDEVHRCGGMPSLNSKLLIAAKRQAGYILCLSATAANDPRQLKALGYVLNLFPLPKFKWWLLSHGCTPGIWGGFDLTDDLMDQAEAMVKINSEIFPKHGARMRKELIPGFPKTEITTKLIEDETGAAQTTTEELKKAFKGRAPLALLMRLRQELELLKVPFAVEMAKDAALTSKVIIFVNFTQTIVELKKSLKKEFGDLPVINGENTAEEREDIKNRFQRNEIPILIANNQAGGVGIGLHDPVDKVERTSLIFPCYSAKDLKQVFGRPQRDGGGFSRQLLVNPLGDLAPLIPGLLQ